MMTSVNARALLDLAARRRAFGAGWLAKIRARAG
jgi:hypothetical protein